MLLLMSDLSGCGLSQAELSAAAYRLVEYAVTRRLGLPCPPVERLPGGKPVFAGGAGPCFSISHSGACLLAGVDAGPLGADLELPRRLAPGHYERLFSPEMRRCFDLQEGWTLRESYFKLTGRGDLRKLEFLRRDGRIIAPDERVRCRLYRLETGAVAAAASYTVGFPESIERIAPELLL